MDTILRRRRSRRRRRRLWNPSVIISGTSSRKYCT